MDKVVEVLKKKLRCYYENHKLEVLVAAAVLVALLA